MAIYIKYTNPTVDGDVTTQGFDKQIEVNSFQWGVGRGVGSPTGASGNREASSPSVSEITVTKMLDNASGGLLKEALSSGGKAKLVISFTRTDGNGAVVYLEVTLTDTMISGYSLSSGGDRPSESVSFNFTKIEVKFTPQKADGTAGSPFPVTYDLGLQKLS
ncbi:Hcp family type VI secretion system effector [Acidocella facilis]|uniref:Hcp family type VI secretion system effector n=1 Tax=Acidocella facilis TaxID=525 RepID=UPI001F34D56C|nr:type VI secretion system tube protein Hcp [Acidocella facilis]